MQERHDNDKIEPHNHNEYPLLYKEAELLTSVLGRFLECRKWNILVITWALGIFLIYMPAPSGLRPSGLGIYIRQIPLAHVITITYSIFQGRVYFSLIKPLLFRCRLFHIAMVFRLFTFIFISFTHQIKRCEPHIWLLAETLSDIIDPLHVIYICMYDLDIINKHLIECCFSPLDPLLESTRLYQI